MRGSPASRARSQFDDVVDAICDKLTRRHPHVFGDAVVADAGEQTAAWERMKREERAARGDAGALADVPMALPALTRARKLGARAAQAGFDWPDAAGPRAKIDEELAELDAARDAADPGGARGGTRGPPVLGGEPRAPPRPRP